MYPWANKSYYMNMSTCANFHLLLHQHVHLKKIIISFMLIWGRCEHDMDMSNYVSSHVHICIISFLWDITGMSMSMIFNCMLY